MTSSRLFLAAGLAALFGVGRTRAAEVVPADFGAAEASRLSPGAISVLLPPSAIELQTPVLPALSAEEAQSLEEAGTRLGGSAADYEVKRAALRRLAAEGRLVSLPPISDEHAGQILRALSASKPRLAAIDFDGTLARDGHPMAPELGAALAASAGRGVETAILTTRSARAHGANAAGILDALGTMTPAQRAAIRVAAQSGGELVSFDAAGEPRPSERAPGWSPSEREALREAARLTAEAYGAPGAVEMTDYDLSVTLRTGLDEADVAAAGVALLRELAARAGSVPSLYARYSGSAAHPSYLFVRKYDKSFGVRRLRGSIPGSFVLLVGDQFFGQPGVDAEMPKGAPGALAISVGGTADPRLDGVFVWPRTGPEGTRQILEALGRAP